MGLRVQLLKRSATTGGVLSLRTVTAAWARRGLCSIRPVLSAVAENRNAHERECSFGRVWIDAGQYLADAIFELRPSHD